MQSLIHGNFEGDARKKTYALVGASAAIAAAVGPLLGGFVTTYLSWRVGFLVEVVIIAIVLSNMGLVRDVAYTAGSFGVSFGLAVAGGVLLATLSVAFTHMAESSKVIPPASQQRIADELEHDAQVVSATQLQEQLDRQPPRVRDEIVRINDDATHRSLQVALLVPILAGLLGLFNAFRMLTLPDRPVSASADSVLV